MTQISSSADLVALVQTSLMLPVALVSTPAGDARPPACFLLRHWQWNGLVRTRRQASVSEQVPAEALPSAVHSMASVTTSPAGSDRRSAASLSRQQGRSPRS